ncbi:NRDE family protein, partial [Alteromonas sp. 14N.309.X.WAT.G.H12]|uniref:NRDE family protein n=1 Tax=Alteromonas sp. 14N.309.X.WAT.G.H12 TaxID=3120824 RepID=UPI002FCEC1F2
IRDMAHEKAVQTSRGELVTGFLNAAEANTPFAKTLEDTRHQYQGYNLLYGSWRSLQVYNNRDNTFTALTPGIFGLSNDALNTPWPKVTAGMEKLSHYCTHNKTIATDTLFDLLADTTQADVHTLPDTGIGQEWEIRLSSIFIKSEQYGTRSSTLLLVDPNGLAQWCERTFDKNGHIVTFRKTEFSFSTELE